MQKLGEELGVLRKGLSVPRKITHTGINGEDVELSLDPASLSDDGASFSAPRWIIHYSSIEELTVKRDICSFNPQTAFLPMQITSCTTELEDNQDLNWEDRPTISTKGLHGLFQDVVRQWRMSQHHEEIQRVITAAAVPLKLNKVVAFGCGPLTLNSELDDRPMIQHALLLTLQSCLPHGGCYVQDPLYEQADKHVLETFGFHVLDDPEVFLMADEASILLSIRADVPVKQIVASNF
ncbi:uncharacterized protein JN550_004214 [Neoarthrinium moseri]|uniref:uncharacterized protein n=1 Tax=Neoarthrinium moseri TaxID=1658444 RepID=UPI001FDB93B1|nr:uncharacterized protein JN550_004214 [Neoarthrinium moseri]KAI1872011.1 hypothetical protein JN550_004214 [Neoarthrinium moseri]